MSNMPRESSLLPRLLVDRVPSMMAYWDSDLKCRFANRAYERWFGVDPDQLVGQSLRDLLGPELFAKNEPYATAALAGTEQTFERVVPGPGGVERHSLASYLPDIVDGQVLGFVAMVTEVTELKRTEAQLRALVATLEAEIERRHTVEANLSDTQQNLAMTLASIDAGFIATDRQGRVCKMNSVSERLTGWSQAEAVGQVLWQVFEREGRPEALSAENPVDVVADRGFTVDVAHHVTVISRSGQNTPVEVKVALTHAPDGSPSGMAMVIRDQSWRMAAEIDASRLAAIVESSQDAIISKTLAGQITSWNAAAETLFGYTAREAIGRPVQMLIPPDRHDEELRIVSNLARGQRVEPFDTERLTKDGRLVPVSLSISPIRDGAGRIVGASKIVRDITQRRLVEDAKAEAVRLEAENRQMLEATRLKSQFLANMSHELRTPLNAIIGFAELLQSGRVPLGSPKQAVFVGHIATSGRHLLQLINDVLDLSKVEAGKLDFFPEPIDLRRVAKEVADMLHTPFDRKHLALQVAIEPAANDLVLDPLRLKQVLYNYLSNAIKFTPDGGRITIRAFPFGESHIRLEVEDTGVGIAPGQIHRLFSEFQQLDSGYARQHQGTGLGLALTRRLVQAQGGRVGVTSVVDSGSVFYAVLPRRHTAVPDSDEAPEATATLARPDRRLLVVEDDDLVRDMIAAALVNAGFDVSAAGSGAQAVALCKQAGFDALTLDLHLPDRGGLDLLAHLRNDVLQKAQPVIGLSAQGGAGSSASFAIADILSKPLQAGEIAAALATVRRPDGLPARVMVIDDEASALELMRANLVALGADVRCHQGGRDALRDLAAYRPHAIVLDLMMPAFDGFAVLDALHQMPDWTDTPVFIWTSMALTEDEYRRLASSAREILSKGGGQLAVMLERLRGWRTDLLTDRT